SSADIRDNIKKIIDLEKPSIIIAESIWALQALPIEISARIHCVIHDVATDFFKEMFVSHNEVVRKILFFNDYLKLKITEENIIKRLRVEQFIFLTEEDKCWYKTRYNIDEGCCSLASNHLYVEKIKRTINFQTPFLLIPGSIEFSQNFYGLNWFIKNIYPGLNRKIRIVVTGKASDKKIKMLNCGEEITFTGELDFSTYNKLSSTCLCVIAPITTGTGIKIKILEAVQKGIPVLTTKFASKGICSDLCFYCEEDTDTNFVNLINSFLETTLRVQE
ncbi:glycosyltransferase, partial [Escherichia coli]